MRFADLEGRERIGEIVTGGVVGNDGKRSDVRIAVAGKHFVVPAGNVFNNTFDHLDELNEMVAVALEQAQQEEEEAAALDAHDAAYANEVAASAEAEASRSNEANVLTATEKAKFEQLGLNAIPLAAKSFMAEMAAPDSSDCGDESPPPPVDDDVSTEAEVEAEARGRG